MKLFLSILRLAARIRVKKKKKTPQFSVVKPIRLFTNIKAGTNFLSLCQRLKYFAVEIFLR